MPFKIQRVPRGLNDLLSSFGGVTPAELEDRVQAVVELIQFYGLQQRVSLTGTSGAVGTSLTVPGVTVTPSNTSWSVLFGAHGGVTNVTAATTQLGFGICHQRPGGLPSMFETFNGVPVVASNVLVGAQMPFPLLLPPGSTIGALLFSTLGAGTQVLTITADVGLLG